METIEKVLRSTIASKFQCKVVPELSRTDERFGDYATNVAMQIAKQLNKSPREIAEVIAEELRQTLAGQIKDVTIAGPGFINISLTDSTVLEQAVKAADTKPSLYKGQVIVAEYSDPNPFKVLHAGHLYTSIVGASIANLIEAAGGTVHRVNFGGDVGLHVGKTMWAILQDLGGELPEKLDAIRGDARSEWMARCYVAGTAAYEDDEQAKASIVELNKRVYKIQSDNDRDSDLARIYWTCRQWSYDYFDAFYARIGTPFERYYPESECAPIGLQTVQEQLQNGVYQESDGAIIFKGEDYGLHTRVFINTQGLPTYEAKDVGLIMLKWRDYHFDRSLIITGNEQEQYMAVVLKSIQQFAPELVKSTTHLTHGIVKLQGGVKMSSRKGNILRAVDVIDAANTANEASTGRKDEQAVLGAVKYSFLKQRIGADIIYNPDESVSMLGNSGPYLQYAHARARSILSKLTNESTDQTSEKFDDSERSFARKIGEYPEVLEQAVQECMPHYVCTYLYELAQVFNRFYEHNRVMGDAREALRSKLVLHYADVLKDGLGLLGIVAPERM